MDREIQAFVPEPARTERIAAETAAVTTRWPDPADRPPLFGVPVGIKDIIQVDTLPTRAGSALPPEALAGRQATVVDRLRAAGAVVAGKTVTAEFAVLAPGPTRNPHNLAHTPGGSSSGSAAAVAAGMVPLAVGTQTVGSVIRPGAYCGVAAFKPTYGRIPVDGVIANAPSFDTLGLFAADVAGLAPAAAVVCDNWRPAVPTTELPVLGIPEGPYLEHAEPDALDAFRIQVDRLEAAGHLVRRIAVMTNFEQVRAQLFTMNRYEVARTHADWFAEYGELYRPETAQAIRAGQLITEVEYARAQRERVAFRDRMAAAMADIDLWITPSATGPAPKGLATTGSSVMSLPWSNAGLPSLNVPAGVAGNGLPLGVQCVAAAGRDEELLGWGPAIEATLR
ncbi:amidase [Streptomyces sp. NBC_01387]|uniref:amidase n=1 Tax=unclassified Streptomyces TaxID=2593676 RepID=UPI0020256E8F|nr:MULTISPECIES: amidase [unclassified Streptomyces]MCX4547970.1 amidase [Streptomyces sp. NBC_01500]WSC19641.1 amidase [Streptomyces sp. NBC_01766]WSV53663.1 amidase [Streptomyces sp. NBC_01014]